MISMRQSFLPEIWGVRHRDLDDPDATPLTPELTQDEPDPVASPDHLSMHADIFGIEELQDSTIAYVGVEGSVPGGLVPPGADPLYIPLPEGIETSVTDFDNLYWQRRIGKTSARKAVRRFFMTGKCKYNGHWIRTPRELAQYFSESIIAEVSKNLHSQRSWWTLKMTATDQVITSPPAHKEPRRRNDVRVCSFNISTLYDGDRLRSVLQQYSDYDIVCLQGTSVSHAKRATDSLVRIVGEFNHVRAEHSLDNFWILSWGYNMHGKCSTNKCGVIIALNKRRIPREHIKRRLDPTKDTAGRFGVVVVQLDQDELVITNTYAPQESASVEQKQLLWQVQNAHMQTVSQRATYIATGDFNGDLVPQEHDRLVGPLHCSQKTTENGELLHAYVQAHSLMVPQTWQCYVKGHEHVPGWRGSTFFGNGDTRIDFILASKHARCKDTHIDVARGYLFRMGEGISMLDHAPVCTKVEFDNDLRYREKAQPAVRWNYTALRAANDDQFFRDKFIEELDTWAKTHYDEFVMQPEWYSDPSPVWENNE